jgi:serine/threonine protein kinase
MGEKTKLNTEIFGISEVWMPREYLHEESVSPKTDVWSLGCVIFYIYSRGHKPWELAKANMVTVLLYNREDFFKHVEDNAV